MQFISTFGAASGHAGGLVASHGRAGAQLRVRVFNCQPRSVSQVTARARTGSLPSLWRLLTPAEHETWAALAKTAIVHDALGQSVTLSGYSLYIACARRLITIGILEPLRAAPVVPSIPPIYGFTATPVYNAPGTSGALEDILLTTSNPLPPDFTPILRASAALSPTRFNIRASNLRVIQAGVMWPGGPYGVLTLWQTIYGSYPLSGAITFELSLVDPFSGLVGAAVRAATSYSYTPTPAPTPGTVTVEVEGVTIAEIPDTYFQVEGINVTD
jgi:hypothetical protein